jgi:hypothetical protein
MKDGARVLANDAEMLQTVTPAWQSLLGENAVLDHVPQIMGSEDFHHLVIENEAHRYLYLMVGTANPEHFKKAQDESKQIPYCNHNPDYQVDLDAIPPVTAHTWPTVVTRWLEMDTRAATVTAMRHLFTQAELSRLKRGTNACPRPVPRPMPIWNRPSRNVRDSDVMGHDLGREELDGTYCLLVGEVTPLEGADKVVGAGFHIFVQVGAHGGR